jgi:pimeloyl-ACP methyl ester carboxylesterase
MTSTGNPLERTVYADNPPVSSKTFPIAGILTHVLGLAELPTPCTSVSVLWLLHPRLQQADCMLPLGSLCINTWNRRQQQRGAGASTHGLLAVTFDQRNHGTRLVDAAANGSWRDGNERHAQDMFSVFHGTAVDVGLLIDHLGSYVFEDRAAPHPPIAQNLVLGISLGGHAAWQVLFAEPRVEAAVVIIGCPDYMRASRHPSSQTSNSGKTDAAQVSWPTAHVSPSGRPGSRTPAHPS